MLRPANLADDVVTFDEFCHLVPDGQKADLIDGVIYIASPDVLRSDQITNFVHSIIASYVEARNLGGVVIGIDLRFNLPRSVFLNLMLPMSAPSDCTWLRNAA